ncbi:MAG: dethiobiotin synthase [Myxococcales bacterium]|nr:dethiobiotin synthase [Myxococcales bacterium]HQY64760.1 dethiobiotin synthase [Polyangiaceae bacterium]
MGRLVVVTGVGTEVGKTTLGVALARGLAASGLRVCGYKPVESGLGPGAGGDAGALDDAGTFHVKPTPLYGFAEPISPHLAAERAGLQVDVEAIVAVVEAARKEVDVLLVELAGGLFTPLGPETDNANLLEALRPDEALLVVPDALGALHHARAGEIAARARGLGPMHLVLVEPGRPDASTGTNSAALRGLFRGTHHVPWRSAGLSAADLCSLLAVCRPSPV